ncbi:uncharacterized protein [Arachis hypogaea]|uniref:Remorin C-terminal domain-containing protein n=1 Tax=Arachis hypogaea TaxID=3818 RepID=A0A444ZS82_ARAHY|nr:uncharacterized protein LOC112792574 [Arachis hypogaea]XP_025691646.1 uncharacterized protein LOC112792574 [Arachis hypogaea]XP_025691647.1 uncharacterized protein LOC112792574 [Arachis hypogaea]XP_025691649.1 uncharacterized protein LOC112792574 [Arachis hypogaea]XP_025691650.1 uncharacterized protein LOC112792574 [Arachis hypogaea]QHO04116.1 uncharacterized protein DS421_13g437810 [Arachis hypogaea]QHO04117.1 uncharacterized protein DS421_13g437810 [Arachis hypogaea]QHO04118.1 uncharact
MRYLEDKGCYNNHGPTAQDTPNSSAMYSDFHKGNNAAAAACGSSHQQHRTTMGKPTPSKWDDAQKWLVGLSKGGGEKSHQSKSSKPRDSNADDLRLIAPVPQKENGYSSASEKEDEDQEHDGRETMKIECCDESLWRTNYNNNNKGSSTNSNSIAVQSICFRDMGTEMTPIASQEPSRTATPIRATTPATRSPIHSGASTPARPQNGGMESHSGEGHQGSSNPSCKVSEKKAEDHARKLSPLESRALAWDEAERAKYMARFKREEVRIQAWENHQIRKAEMEMKKTEVKAERMKALAQEKLANKLAATRRIAEEKRANAQVKLNEKALRTTERADYIRRTGQVPSAFSFSFNCKFPSLCCCW